MPQLIIGIIILAVIIKALEALFTGLGKLFSALFIFAGWSLYSMAALVDRLFGQWGNSPLFSWGLTGLVLGTSGYFVSKEARKLSRPLLSPILVSSCSLLMIASPFIGPKTAKRPETQLFFPTTTSPTVLSIAGSWNGYVGKKKAYFTISQSGEQLSGDVVYEKVRKNLEGNVSGKKITLRGTGWTRLNGTNKNFSLDTFTGDLSSDNSSFYGQYRDAAGHTGNWRANRVNNAAVNKPNESQPQQPAQANPASPPKTEPDTNEIVSTLIDRPQKKNRDKELHYGEALIEGKSIPKNPDKGISLLKLSAQHGSGKAQKILGGIYYKGEVVAQNYGEAAKYYKMAAEGGAPEAQHFYGMMLAKGVGIEQDVASGTAWIKKAADKGYADAKKVIDQLESNR